MEILPSKIPSPRLLSGISTPPAASENDRAGAQFVRAGVLRTRNRWWLLLLLLAAVLILAGPTLHERYVVYRQRMRDVRLIPVATNNLAAAPHSAEAPQAISIEYSPEMLQVTAIALGHPRLAVINGRTLTEGDSLVLHAPTRNVAITLRVERIADGHVDLFDGTHIVAAHLVVPSMKPVK